MSSEVGSADLASGPGRLPATRPRGISQKNLARMVLGMLVLGLAWRVVRYAVCFPIWGDEAFVVASFHTRDFAGMFRPLEYAQIVPLGFMWAELAVTRALGMSEWALRTPAFVCGLFSLVLFWRFAWRRLDRRSALLATAIFAASYYVVRHSAEVKPYACDLAVSLVLIWLAWAVYRKSDSVLRWAGLTAATAAGVWFSYPAAFMGGTIVILLAVAAWRRRSWKVFGAWSVYCLALGASFLAMYLLYARPHAEAARDRTDMNIRTWKNAAPPLNEPWRLPLWLLDIHTGNLLAYPVGGKNGGSSATCLLVIIGSVALWRRRRRALLWLLLGPLALMLVAAAMKKYPYGTSARVAQHMAPAFCLLAGVGLSSALRVCLRRRGPARGFVVATGLMAAIAVAGMVADIVRPQKKFADRANRDALRVLSARTEPRDQWVVFNAFEQVPHAPDLHDFGGSGARFLHYVRRQAPGKLHLSPPGDRIPPNPEGRTWLLVYRDNKVPFPQDQLERYLRVVYRGEKHPQPERFKLTHPKDPHPGGQIEAIDVFQLPQSPPPASSAPASSSP